MVARRSRWLTLLLGLALTPTLATPAAAKPAPAPQCFTVPSITNCLDGRFRSFWNDNGGLPVFGYPFTAQRAETNADTHQVYQTQWFERNRFELHPENAPPYDVLLGRLGAEGLARLGRGFEPARPGPTPKTRCQTFSVGGQPQAVCDPFLKYWESHGLEFDGRAGFSFAESLALFGLPLTYPQLETNPNGDRVVTQWFERARFEDHGDKGVLLGLLGNEAKPPASPPTAGVQLPAPAYVLANQQLQRIETDGSAGPVISADGEWAIRATVAPNGGAVAYLTLGLPDNGGQSTVRRTGPRGEGRNTLITGQITDILWTPGGDALLVGLGGPASGVRFGNQTITPGLWSFPTGGGPATQLVANRQPVTRRGEMIPGIRYAPKAWSPDGHQLLLLTFPDYGPDAPGGDVGVLGLAVLPSSGPVRELIPNVGKDYLCIEATWARDSAAVYCSNNFDSGGAALYRLNVQTAERTTLIPRTTDGLVNLVVAVADLSDGLYSVVGQQPADGNATPRFTAQRTAADGRSNRVVLAENLEVGYQPARLAPDGSGLLAIVSVPEQTSSRLVWYRFGGATATLVDGEIYGAEWGAR